MASWNECDAATKSYTVPQIADLRSGYGIKLAELLVEY